MDEIKTAIKQIKNPGKATGPDEIPPANTLKNKGLNGPDELFSAAMWEDEFVPKVFR